MSHAAKDLIELVRLAQSGAGTLPQHLREMAKSIALRVRPTALNCAITGASDWANASAALMRASRLAGRFAGPVAPNDATRFGGSKCGFDAFA